MELDSAKILSGIVNSLRAIKIKKICFFFGKHAFGLILSIILLELILGGIIFYKYAFLAEKTEPGISANNFKFKENSYQEILKEWEQRDIKFQENFGQDIQSPF
jgi:hypothetical protein